MNTLQSGSAGESVKRWQAFLLGLEMFSGVVDGRYGPITCAATRVFQSIHNIDQTGIVDHQTLICAMQQGFEVLSSADASEAPKGLYPLTQKGRATLFGAFDFTSTPGSDAIVVSPAWLAANIVQVQIDKYPNAYRTVCFHRLAADRLKELFSAWKSDGLLDRVVSFDGSYAPRYVRGSKTTLSAHAWGTAFDINAKWNALGAMPATLGSYGCVRELVARANQLGFYWGGHFSGRRDGMHFELVRL